MANKRNEKGLLHRLFRDTIDKKTETNFNHKEESKQMSGAEVFPELFEEDAAEDFTVGVAEEHRPDDRMEDGGSFLETARREFYAVNTEDTEAYYSEFMVDGKEPPEDKKEFIIELQATAKVYSEIKESKKEKPVNAQVCIKVPPDRMEAWMFVFPPKNGGKEITEDLIEEALEQCDVLYGIEAAFIRGMVRKRVYLKLGVVAHGLLPEDGINGKVTDHFPRIAYNSDETEGETIDYTKLNLLHAISEGDIICDLIFPRASVDGSKVTGEIIKGQDYRAFIIPNGENTGVNEEKTALISKLKGTLFFENGKFHVKDIRHILSDVDLTIGNIDTIGNLEIRGDVLGGFKVKATGNIRIHGIVGNSIVIAGGDIKIDMGIKGVGEAFIQAGGNVESNYIENCTVKARGSINANSIINCTVSADVNVESKIIIGGSIAALRQVHAKTVGNPQRRQTTFSLGNTQEIRQEKISLELHLKDLDFDLEHLSKSIRFLQNKKERSPEDEEARNQVTMEYRSQIEEKKKSEKRLEEINDGIKDYSNCELTASILYPPVTVMIANDSCVINREQSMSRIWSEDGEIRML